MRFGHPAMDSRSHRSLPRIHFCWTGKRWIYDTPPLTLAPVTHGHRSPGTHLRPDGKQEDTTIDALLLKTQQWADQLRSRPLPAATSWLALTTTLMKTLEYPLRSSTLTPKDCTKILWPALEVALPQSKLQRRFPRALLAICTSLRHGNWAPLALHHPALSSCGCHAQPRSFQLHNW